MTVGLFDILDIAEKRGIKLLGAQTDKALLLVEEVPDDASDGERDYRQQVVAACLASDEC